MTIFNVKSASATPSLVSAPPVNNNTNGTGDGDGTGTYIYDAATLTGAHYGGQAVVVKKLPEQCTCCEQKCAKTNCVEYPTRWCKKRKTVCARSERCKEYEYKYYDSPRCAEWATKVVLTEKCLQWQPITYNTGICTRYENKYVH